MMYNRKHQREINSLTTQTGDKTMTTYNKVTAEDIDNMKSAINSYRLTIEYLNDLTDEAKKVIGAPTIIDIENAITMIETKIEELTIKPVVNPIRFLMYKVTNGEHVEKVWYSRIGNDIITVISENYGYGLEKIIPEATNKTDSMTDYFDFSRVKISSDSPYWKAVDAACSKREASMKKRAERWG